jgi:hypothetical protein
MDTAVITPSESSGLWMRLYRWLRQLIGIFMMAAAGYGFGWGLIGLLPSRELPLTVLSMLTAALVLLGISYLLWRITSSIHCWAALLSLGLGLLIVASSWFAIQVINGYEYQAFFLAALLALTAAIVLPGRWRLATALFLGLACAMVIPEQIRLLTHWQIVREEANRIVAYVEHQRVEQGHYACDLSGYTYREPRLTNFAMCHDENGRRFSLVYYFNFKYGRSQLYIYSPEASWWQEGTTRKVNYGPAGVDGVHGPPAPTPESQARSKQ